MLLRCVAGLTFLSVMGTLLLVGSFWLRGALPLMVHSAIGLITIFGWFVTLIAGTPAFVFLWKPSDLGRFAAAITWGSIGLYYLLLIGPSHNFNLRALAYIAVSAAIVALVLSPLARRLSYS
jgi:hypothetical protein